MISKSISISTKVNSISDFAALLFTWMVPHADDYGVLDGSPGTVKALVVPRRKQTEKQVEAAIGELQKVGLIWWYMVEGKQYIQFVSWEKHQDGLQKRTKSKYPLYQDGGLNVNEADIEKIVSDMINSGNMLVHGISATTERQLRINNSYIDIACYDAGEMVCIIELKRHKLSNAALDQMIGYKKALIEMGKNPLLVLLGHGIAVNFDIDLAIKEQINIYGYDDKLRLECILLSDVKPCQITNEMLITNLTEPNLTEPNRREQNCASAYDYFSDFWKEYPRKEAKADAVKAFAKLKMNDELMDTLMAGLFRATESEAWLKDGGKFIPYPATWLNGRRWEDGN